MMQQQFIGAQAAVLRLDTDVSPEGFGVGLSNVRDVAAKDVHLKIQITHESLPGEAALGDPIIKNFDPPAVPVIEKEKAFHVTIPIPWPLQIQQVGDEPWPGKRTVEFKGELSYNDGFDNRVSESFCYAWTPITRIITKTQNSTVGGLLDCDGLQLRINGILQSKSEAANESHPN
ncbi:MAG: hypothetical protein WAM91_09190 [Candidatus Acidiferrales bacterium]